MPRVKKNVNSNDLPKSIMTAVMVRNGLDNRGMMKILGLKGSSYYRKKRDSGMFRIHEIRTLQKVLNLSDEEVMQIVLGRKAVLDES